MSAIGDHDSSEGDLPVVNVVLARTSSDDNLALELPGVAPLSPTGLASAAQKQGGVIPKINVISLNLEAEPHDGPKTRSQQENAILSGNPIVATGVGPTSHSRMNRRRSSLSVLDLQRPNAGDKGSPRAGPGVRKRRGSCLGLSTAAPGTEPSGQPSKRRKASILSLSNWTPGSEPVAPDSLPVASGSGGRRSSARLSNAASSLAAFHRWLAAGGSRRGSAAGPVPDAPVAPGTPKGATGRRDSAWDPFKAALGADVVQTDERRFSISLLDADLNDVFDFLQTEAPGTTNGDDAPDTDGKPSGSETPRNPQGETRKGSLQPTSGGNVSTPSIAATAKVGETGADETAVADGDLPDPSSSPEKRCTNCNTTETPRWRYNVTPENPVLCNACGLYYARNKVMRPRSVQQEKKSKPRKRRSRQPGGTYPKQRRAGTVQWTSFHPSGINKTELNPQVRNPTEAYQSIGAQNMVYELNGRHVVMRPGWHMYPVLSAPQLATTGILPNTIPQATAPPPAVRSSTTPVTPTNHPLTPTLAQPSGSPATARTGPFLLNLGDGMILPIQPGSSDLAGHLANLGNVSDWGALGWNPPPS